MKPFKLSHMCDRCLETLGVDEDMYGMKISDDNNEERIIKGHKHCIEYMKDEFDRIYGEKETE